MKLCHSRTILTTGDCQVPKVQQRKKQKQKWSIFIINLKDMSWAENRIS